MTTILLIRHGENNMVGKRLAGRLPGVHLNDRGKKQAQQVAEVLCKAPIKAIYSSPLERAVETAEIAFAGASLTILHDWRLRECDYGEQNGMPRAGRAGSPARSGTPGAMPCFWMKARWTPTTAAVAIGSTLTCSA